MELRLYDINNKEDIRLPQVEIQSAAIIAKNKIIGFSEYETQTAFYINNGIVKEIDISDKPISYARLIPDYNIITTRGVKDEKLYFAGFRLQGSDE